MTAVLEKVSEKPCTEGHTLYDFIHVEYPEKDEEPNRLLSVTAGDGGLEMDILEDLESLQFERGIEEEDRSWLYLQRRCHGLMIKGCAHATFFCKLLHNLSKLLQEKQTSRCSSTESLANAPDDDNELKVGIIGGGHLGKQLARVLLQLVPIPAERLRISTRRPEALDEFQKLEVQCFYDNSHLVGWANLVFLCCLPSQLPSICTEIQSSFRKACIVYSFVSAVPIPRLKNLLNHTNILRPQYQCVEGFAHIVGANKEIIAALQDPVILQATCPSNPAGGIILNIKWLDGVFYAALNVCTAKSTCLSQALQLVNELFPASCFKRCRKDGPSCPKFQLQHFLNENYIENLSPQSCLPWFDLTIVQVRDTPFSDNLLDHPALQDHLTHLYCDSFGISLPEEQHYVVGTGSPGSPSE